MYHSERNKVNCFSFLSRVDELSKLACLKCMDLHSSAGRALQRNPLKPRKTFFFGLFSQLLKLRFTAMVTYSFHTYYSFVVAIVIISSLYHHHHHHHHYQHYHHHHHIIIISSSPSSSSLPSPSSSSLSSLIKS